MDGWNQGRDGIVDRIMDGLDYEILMDRWVDGSIDGWKENRGKSRVKRVISYHATVASNRLRECAMG